MSQKLHHFGMGSETPPSPFPNNIAVLRGLDVSDRFRPERVNQLHTYTMTANSATGPLLVVEDNPDIWIILKAVLPLALPGVEVMHAADAPTALTTLRDYIAEGKTPLRLVLQNLYLPERADGLALLSDIKQEGLGGAPVPVVVMSSSNDQRDKTDAYRLGANAYLVKPTDITDWIKALHNLKPYWQQTVS